jgi:DNA repair protein RecN (Recombination protein N)
MLEHLSVRDFALLDEAEVDFSRGLVLFTGETGAGKSLVVGSIGFLFGGRGDTSVIREGAEDCLVAATLSLDRNPKAIAWLEAHDIGDEGGWVFLKRGLRRNGRSYAYIQNRPVSRADLAEFTALLADIHGQHEHQKLMDPHNHLDILDRFGDLSDERRDYAEAYDAWMALVRDYRTMLAEAERRMREKDLLAFTLEEIKAAKPRAGEDEALEREEKLLSQHEKIFEAISTADAALAGSQGSTQGSSLEAIRRARNALGTALSIDASLADLCTRLESLYLELEDLGDTVSAYRENLRFDPVRLEEVERRLAELKRLKKKYGPSLADVLERETKASEALASLESLEDNRAALEEKIRNAKRIAMDKALVLSEKRQVAAKAFTARVEAILGRLGMPGAGLAMDFRRRLSDAGKPILSGEGLDEVEMLIAPNRGESPKALARIASGGELSRVALAIKAVMASRDIVDTLIFDEIDTGIGGEVAVAVGTYLKNVAAERQVLCVTHLASIASQADLHYRVDKRESGGRTVTKVERLEGQAREREIARMLSGDREGTASLAHAAELLRRSVPGQIVQGVMGEKFPDAAEDAPLPGRAELDF